MTSSGLVLSSGDALQAHITYDGTTLAMTLSDAVTNKSFSHSWTINIPSVIGSNTAFVGFTGGTGGGSSSQKVESWTFTPGAPAGGGITRMVRLHIGFGLAAQRQQHY